MNKLILISCIFLINFNICQEPKEPCQKLEKFFNEYNVTGAFISYSEKDSSYIRYNIKRCEEQFIPAGTFDIMCSLIGLQTRLIKHKNFIIVWNGKKSLIPSWNQNHTLETALQNSVRWYFQKLSKRIGQPRIKKYIIENNYGNMDISGGDRAFWHASNLRISPEQQIDFVRRLKKNNLTFSNRYIRLVKRILIFEKKKYYIMVAKPGRGFQDGKAIGWFIGYIQKKDDTIYFATNIESENPDTNFGKARIEITKNILYELGYLGEAMQAN